MDSAIAGLIGAGIGAIAGLLGSVLSNWLLVRKDEERWLRERQSEHDKWLRERLQETYSNSIDYLSRLFRRSEITAKAEVILAQEHQRELFTDYSEAQKWLGLLVIYYPTHHADGTPISGDYENFLRAVGEFSMSEMPNLQKAKELRSLIIAMAATDDRLQLPSR
jgi:hypothetical protein